MQVFCAERLIDGTGADPIPNGAVVVDGERIAFVGPADDARHHAGDGAEVVELDGETLLPGIVDAHSHLSIIPGEGDQIGQLMLLPPDGINITPRLNINLFLSKTRWFSKKGPCNISMTLKTGNILIFWG